jgi:hypothetical protein
MLKLLLIAAAILLACAQLHADRSPTERARDKVAAQMDVGESAPDWLMDSETYAIGYNPGDWLGFAQSKVSFVTHCPVNREFFAMAHRYGIRCFPYVTFYQGNADRTYEGLNLKDHPEYIEIDAQGNLKRTGFWESEDAKNMYTTCPNVQGYQDAMVAWVRKIMELGADGVFVDNLGARVDCFGPKFDKHKHIYENQDHAFAMLLKRVREVVKSYKPDGAVLGNSAAPLSLPREYWKYLDADMMESYICTWVSKDRWFDWKTFWHENGVKLQPLVKAGKQIQCLSYLGSTPFGVREDAFYCYASARLGGFVWSGGTAISHPDVAILHQIRLGKPLGDEQVENGVYYRVFEKGFVALNPDKTNALDITVKPPIPTTKLVDIAGGAAKSWSSAQGSNDALDVTVQHSGSRSVRITNLKPDESLVSQSVTLNQTKPTPILAGGWSKAQGATGAQDGNYSIYLDIQYADGSNLFGQIAPFTPGTHDWEYKSVLVKPTKPIKSLNYNLIFRFRTGTVWFDDVSLKEGDDPQNGVERLQNGGLEEVGGAPRVFDAASSGGKVRVPAYSGRVYLYGSDTADQLTIPGPCLHVAANPPMGEVRFRVDGFDYWTHAGHWTTEYTLGPDFGRFDIVFDKPGKHTVEIMDVVPSAMKTPKGYGSGERLGQFMDPSQPTKPLGNRNFKFREWTGPVASKTPKIEVDVKADMTLTAQFDVTGG